MSTDYQPWPRPPHNIRAVRELATLAAQTGVRLQVSHVGLAGRRSWRLVDAVLEEVEDGKRAGGDIGFDVVPYPLGVGPMQMLFPPSSVQELQQGRLRRRTRSRLRLMAAVQPHLLGLGLGDVELLRSRDHRAAEFAGLDFTQIGRQLGKSPIDAQITVALQSRLGAAVALCGFSGDETDEGPLEALLTHRDAAVVSNAASSAEGVPNPTANGAFPRLLGRFVRQRRTLTLEEAVRRATALPAERLGVPGIGRITEGARADLVILDPATVDDGGWPKRPAGPPRGIHTVIVGGRVAAQRGTVVSVGNGRLLHS
ncbi:MAG TPA: amidohydrolase family protein [Nocardioidaceae bacterium]|nr:amidohydrolase family protein [Nocardioidaceae bacterium]